MRRSAFLSALLSVCVSTAVFAQPPAPPRPQETAKAASSALPYVVEQLRTRVRFENDGTGRRERTTTVKVLDESGVRAFGELRLPYQSESETLTITKVDVHKPDGSTTSTPATAIQDVDVRPPTPAATYLDIRQKIITVSALRPGDRIEVTAVWSVTKPLASDHFWFEHVFDVSEPVQDEQLEIDVPAQRAVAMKLRDGAPAEDHGGAGAVSGDRRVYRWKTAHPEPPAEGENKPATREAPPADVRLSSFRNWNEFATWYGTLAALPSDDTVKAKAASLTAGARDEAAKIAAIYQFVSTEIRYVSLSFGVGRFAPHAPADVLAHQYGDCKDKAILLKALLEAAGVHAVPVLLNSRRSIADDFASPAEFDHVIAMVPAAPPRAAALWLDSTLEVAPPGMLIASERNRKTLTVEGPGRAAVVSTPADPPFPAVENVSIDGTVNSIGVLVATGTMTLRGDSEVLTRAVVRSVGRDNLKAFVKDLVSENGIDGEFSEVTTTDPVSTAEPFRITFKVRKPGYLDWAAARSQAETMPSATFRAAKPEDRKGLERLELGSPMLQQLRAAIQLPDGYAAEPPPPVAASKAGIEYSAAYRVEGRRLFVERDIHTAAREIPASAFSDYTVLAGIAEKDFAQQFTITTTIAGTPTLPADATAAELYSAGFAAYTARRYDASVTIWKRSVELDPKMGDAWIGLGLAYQQLEKYDAAAAAIEKQIALDPNDTRAHRDLGSVLNAAGRDEEAAKAYARHIEINPLDGDTLKDLGIIYNHLGRHADAATVLEKAAAILKPVAAVFTELGTAHLHLKAPDKARAAFDRALELSPSIGTRTKIAWELAEAGIDLERAKTLATLAEKEVADATQQLDAATVKSRHLDMVERAAWDWDALGWIAFRNGEYAQADRYVRAAWQVLGRPGIAYHLAQICEKRDRLADALSYYLTAHALSPHPTEEMRAHITKLSGGGDVKAMLASAKQMAPGERVVRLEDRLAPGTAEFLVIVGGSRTVTDVRFRSGDESLKALEGALRRATYPIAIPGDPRVRLALGVSAKCDARAGCSSFIRYPYQVKVE